MDIKKLQDSYDKLQAQLEAKVNFAADGETKEPLTDEQSAEVQKEADELATLKAEIETLKGELETARSTKADEVESKNFSTATDSILNTVIDKGNSMKELTFSAIKEEINAFARGDKAYEFAAITVAGNQAAIPTNVAFGYVRRNGNAFRTLLNAYNVQPISLPFAHNFTKVFPVYNEGVDGTENSASTDAINATYEVEVSPRMITSGASWMSEVIASNPAYDSTGEASQLFTSVERREEAKAFAAAKAAAVLDADMIGLTTAAAGVITYAEARTWLNSIGVYRSDAAVIGSSTFKTMIENVVDDNGRPIFTTGTDGLTKLDGMPFILSDSFEGAGVSKYIAAIVSASSVVVAEVPETLKSYTESAHAGMRGLEVIRYSATALSKYGVKFLRTAAA